jgi:guanylate kinase
LQVAEEELDASEWFDCVIVNDDLNRAVQELSEQVATMFGL